MDPLGPGDPGSPGGPFTVLQLSHVAWRARLWRNAGSWSAGYSHNINISVWSNDLIRKGFVLFLKPTATEIIKLWYKVWASLRKGCCCCLSYTFLINSSHFDVGYLCIKVLLYIWCLLFVLPHFVTSQPQTLYYRSVTYAFSHLLDNTLQKHLLLQVHLSVFWGVISWFKRRGSRNVLQIDKFHFTPLHTEVFACSVQNSLKSVGSDEGLFWTAVFKFWS